jgi:hypothetical protein
VRIDADVRCALAPTVPADAKRILRELKLLRLMGAHENLLWVLDVFVWPNAPSFKDV